MTTWRLPMKMHFLMPITTGFEKSGMWKVDTTSILFYFHGCSEPLRIPGVEAV